MTDHIKALIAAAHKACVDYASRPGPVIPSMELLGQAIAAAEARPEPQPDPALRDWPEDFGRENGNYTVLCSICKQRFIGYKRRVACKVCATERPIDTMSMEAMMNQGEARPEPKPDDACDFYEQLPKGPTHGRFSASDRAELGDLKRKAFEAARPEPAAEHGDEMKELRDKLVAAHTAGNMELALELQTQWMARLRAQRTRPYADTFSSQVDTARKKFISMADKCASHDFAARDAAHAGLWLCDALDTLAHEVRR